MHTSFGTLLPRSSVLSPSKFQNGWSVAFAGLLMVAMCGLSGCGDGSPKAAMVEPAKNVYVIQNNNANGVEADTVLTLSATASGVTVPTGTLQLPSSIVAFAVATGPDGTIYVGGPISDTVGEVLVYAPGATGSATPTATLTGGGMGTFGVPIYMAADGAGRLYVFSNDGSIESFAKGATSAAAPLQYLTYATTTNDDYGGIGVDDAGEIFTTDETIGSVDVFGAGATGAATPARTISTTAGGGFAELYGVTVDGPGDVTVMNYNSADDPFDTARAKPELRRAALMARYMHGGARVAKPRDTTAMMTTAVVTFAAGASGTVTPTRTLAGALTMINEPEGVAVDGLGNLYYEDYEGGAVAVMTFAPTATGNVAPKATMTSTAFTTSYFGSIAAF